MNHDCVYNRKVVFTFKTFRTTLSRRKRNKKKILYLQGRSLSVTQRTICWIVIIGAETSEWWRYLQDKGSLSHPLDDWTQTLLLICWEELEMKVGSGMRLAPHISSSDPLLRTPQESLLVPPRLLFCSWKLLRWSGQEASLHPIYFSRKPFLISFVWKF